MVEPFFLRENERGPADRFSLQRRATTFTGTEVDPGESLADTAAQSGVVDIRPFRKAEEALFHKFGLKPRVIPGDNQAVGIGGKAKVLGKVEMPSGMGGVNGIVEYTVVDSPGVPPLTPVFSTQTSWIDLNSNMMDLKKIETTTTLRTLPSGQVAHKLTEFAAFVCHFFFVGCFGSYAGRQTLNALSSSSTVAHFMFASRHIWGCQCQSSLTTSLRTYRPWRRSSRLTPHEFSQLVVQRL